MMVEVIWMQPYLAYMMNKTRGKPRILTMGIQSYRKNPKYEGV
jgi:hypothetical protein